VSIPETKYKRSKNVFSVTYIAFIVVGRGLKCYSNHFLDQKRIFLKFWN